MGAKLKENLASTLTHEVGHALTYCLVDSIYEDKINSPKIEEYRILRGLDPAVYGYGSNWDEHIFEVLTEDIRDLFGSLGAHSAPFTPYKAGKLDPPDERIRKWILSLLPPLATQPPIEVEVVGQGVVPVQPEPVCEPIYTFRIIAMKDLDGLFKVQVGAYNTALKAAIVARRLESPLLKAGHLVERKGGF